MKRALLLLLALLIAAPALAKPSGRSSFRINSIRLAPRFKV